MKRFYRDINEFHFEGMKVAFAFHEIFTIIFEYITPPVSRKYIIRRNSSWNEKGFFLQKIIIRTFMILIQYLQ